MSIFLAILSAFYLLLPAYMANMAPVFFRNTFSFLALPIDGGRKLKGKRIFGDHKTVRGFIFGVLLGILTASSQYLFQMNQFFTSITLLNYSHFILIGFLLGFGALFGDLIKSFFKRRVDIPAGKPFIPFDQIDFTVGALFFICFIYVPPVEIIAISLLLSFSLHILVNRIGYWLNIREGKW